MASMRMYHASGPAGMVMGGTGGATAESFLLPLIIGISVTSFLLSATVASAPTEEEIHYDAALLAYTRGRFAAPQEAGAPVPRPWSNDREADRAEAYGAPAYDALSHGAATNGAAGNGPANNGAGVPTAPPWTVPGSRRPPEPR